MKHPWLLCSLVALSALPAWEFGCADGTSSDTSDRADGGNAIADDDDSTAKGEDSSASVGDDDDTADSGTNTKSDGSTTNDSGVVPTCEGGVCAPTAGLVAYYAFGGNANDSSPSKANGTSTGTAPTTDRFGNANSAYLFNGGAASVNAPNTKLPTGNASHTLAVWAKATAIDTYNAAANWGTSSTTRARFGPSLNDGAPFFTAQKDDVLGSGLLNDSKWHLLVATYDGASNTLNLFVDGAKKATHVYASGIDTTGDPLVIGQKVAPASNENWWGMLDDVRVYDRVLSATELDALLHENGY